MAASAELASGPLQRWFQHSEEQQWRPEGSTCKRAMSEAGRRIIDTLATHMFANQRETVLPRDCHSLSGAISANLPARFEAAPMVLPPPQHSGCSSTNGEPLHGRKYAFYQYHDRYACLHHLPHQLAKHLDALDQSRTQDALKLWPSLAASIVVRVGNAYLPGASGCSCRGSLVSRHGVAQRHACS
jgi:hypothetical protein